MEAVQDVMASSEHRNIEPAPTAEQEQEILKLYSERLVRKLEQKMLELEKEVQIRREAEEELEAARQRELEAAQQLAEERARAASRLRQRALWFALAAVVAVLAAAAAGRLDPPVAAGGSPRRRPPDGQPRARVRPRRLVGRRPDHGAPPGHRAGDRGVFLPPASRSDPCTEKRPSCSNHIFRWRFAQRLPPGSQTTSSI